MSDATSAQALSRDWETTIEPLSSLSDFEEYKAAYASFTSGEWDDERWTAFRLRFGVYGQLQPGVQMIRIKLPGGILPIEWLRSIAAINRKYAEGEAHITTRQDFQLYFVPLARTPDLLEELYSAGLTTREGCGNTLRNMTSCQLSGACPREHVDAAVVADRISRSLLRNPLVQHMPRKFKVSVSGCETDCGASGIHDLGLIATEKNGQKGFIVNGGGGTGGIPIAAVRLLDFVVEEDVPAVLESMIRLHQRYSNRINRNAARIKFLIKRFGEEKFRTLFEEEFERMRILPQRPWTPLDWRDPDEAPEPVSPGGVVSQHDGRSAVVVNPSLGLFTSEQMEALADIAEQNGAEEFRITRDQNFIFMGLPRDAAEAVKKAVRALGFGVEERPGDVANVIACPGTTTCRIGITNSQNFGHELASLALDYEAKPEVSLMISGCQNGCGLHHIADFGFRGMGKKIDGRNAPHYQIYVGGNPRNLGDIGLSGPIVVARYAPEALNILMREYAENRKEGESVRQWSERLGKQGLSDVLAPVLEKATADTENIYLDWGEREVYEPPAPAKSECAATFAVDDLLMDLADDSLIGFDRALFGEQSEEGQIFGHEGIYYAARRLLVRQGDVREDLSHDETLHTVRGGYADNPQVLAALDKVIEAENTAANGGGNGALDSFREALAVWIDTAADLVEKPFEQSLFDASALEDSSGSVMDMIRNQQRGA